MTTELISAPSNQQLAWQNEFLIERMTELELALDSQGWNVLTGDLDQELSRSTLRTINRLARMSWLKNPLIQRGVNVQAYYVYGQGVEVSANDEEMNTAIQVFWEDAKNQAELTSQQALVLKETELTLFGNIYFVFFVNSATGRVRVRTIPVGEIEEIITNPEDSKDPWWYQRNYQVRNKEGQDVIKTTYYRDWRYMGTEKPKGDVSTAVLYHVKVGGLSDMRFGVSEVYAALDWAKAYKNFLEDWATIVRAYSRFAWQLTVRTKKGMQAAKAKLGTTVGDGTGETNPAPVAGSTFMGTPGVNMQPIRTAGATTSAEDGRRLLLMVAASAGLPESFYGDVSVGTLATARSLDRPTELKFVNRQSLWRDVLQAICWYVVLQKVKSTDVDRIQGLIIDDDDGVPELELPDMADDVSGEMKERDLTINVDFPPILEHDMGQSIEGIVKAATLGGSAMAGVIDPQTVTRQLLTALGEQDVEAIMAIIYPPEEEGQEDEPDDEPPPEPTEQEEEDGMVEVLRELRAAVEHLYT